MRSRPFAHAHLRNPRESGVTKAGNQLEISWKSVGNHRNPEISYAEKARVVPLEFYYNGCDNCERFLKMKGNRETIQETLMGKQTFFAFLFVICDFSQNYFGDDSTRKLGQQMAENW